MGKLWHKKVDLDATIERYTAGEDVQLDLALAEYDCLGNIAQARMLERIGILTKAELRDLSAELVRTLADIERGRFTIRPDQEDVHTAVEELLTEAVGDAGRKIHTARSRNDQAALDCRLYARDALLELRRAVLRLAGRMLTFAARHAEVPLVGRTHTQRAMPSSVGLWSSAIAEAMIENAELLETAYALTNRSPLGSAASYGVAIPIDREYTAELLGFERPITNVLYANNTRGKIESEILSACAVLMNDLARAATDVILFSIPETGYFELPERFCPGSSIMPQKKNPGPLELMRARAAVVTGHLVAVLGIVKGLPGGYNRDFQDTKGPMMRGLTTTRDSVDVLEMIVAEMKVNEQACIDAFTPEVYAADEALRMVADEGVPFREAYRRVGLHLDKLQNRDPVQNILAKTHLGATGNLDLDGLEGRVAALLEPVEAEAKRLGKVVEQLTTL
jgi:argininosuccinate lyase